MCEEERVMAQVALGSAPVRALLVCRSHSSQQIVALASSDLAKKKKVRARRYVTATPE